MSMDGILGQESRGLTNRSGREKATLKRCVKRILLKYRYIFAYITKYEVRSTRIRSKQGFNLLLFGKMLWLFTDDQLSATEVIWTLLSSNARNRRLSQRCAVKFINGHGLRTVYCLLVKHEGVVTSCNLAHFET